MFVHLPFAAQRLNSHNAGQSLLSLRLHQCQPSCRSTRKDRKYGALEAEQHDERLSAVKNPQIGF
jgi:hypothetical protein